MASPRDSMTEAMRKLPLSLMRLAMGGWSERMKVLWARASKRGWAVAMRAAGPAVTMASLAAAAASGRPKTGAAR